MPEGAARYPYVVKTPSPGQAELVERLWWLSLISGLLMLIASALLWIGEAVDAPGHRSWAFVAFPILQILGGALFMFLAGGNYVKRCHRLGKPPRFCP